MITQHTKAPVEEHEKQLDKKLSSPHDFCEPQSQYQIHSPF